MRDARGERERERRSERKWGIERAEHVGILEICCHGKQILGTLHSLHLFSK